MKWRKFGRSRNVEFRRGGRRGGGGSRRRGAAIGGGLGLGGLLVVGLISMVTGLDFRTVMSGAELVTGGGGGTVSRERVTAAPGSEMEEFLARVTNGTEIVWSEIFPDQLGRPYEPPRVVAFEGATDSACGGAQQAMGPHYCPVDETVYMDLSFFDQLRTRYGAPGDFAVAYVIAHEVGHHIEQELGILQQVQAAQRRSGRTQANELSVRVELMADCLAGIWARGVEDVLEPGDLREALGAAAAVGDDTLQRRSQGRVVPETFTHGTAEQRQNWFLTGYETGRVDACDDTFDTARL